MYLNKRIVVNVLHSTKRMQVTVDVELNEDRSASENPSFTITCECADQNVLSLGGKSFIAAALKGSLDILELRMRDLPLSCAFLNSD